MTDELAHYGVKGMRWGVRRDSDDKGPSKSQRIKADRAAAKAELPARDAELKAVLAEWKVAAKERNQTKRKTPERAAADAKLDAIDKRVNKADDAWADTYSRTFQKTPGEHAREWGGLAAVLAGSVAVTYGPTLLRNAASSAAARRGAAEAASAMADSRGLTSYRTIALAFDAVSGTWK